MRHALSSGGGDLAACPMVIPLPLVTVANDLIVVPFAVGADLVTTGTMVGGNLEAITAGTLVLDLKNNAGTLLATLTWTAAGPPTVTNRNTSSIGAGDQLHINATSVGTTPLGLSVTLWWRIRG